jgi:hypothetical protein
VAGRETLKEGNNMGDGSRKSKTYALLFQPKIFSEKYFLYFLVFSATKNNNQTENIFGLTKKAYLVSKNELHF